MSEETGNTTPAEETTRGEETQQEQQTVATETKTSLPPPPAIRVEVVHRMLNGEWDDFEEGQPVDKTDFFQVIRRELTKDGELVSEVEYDTDGTELQKTVNIFNEEGKVIRHELFSEGELTEKMEFEYDEKGRVSKETREFNEGFPLVTFFTYDDEGRVIEKRIDDSDGELQKRETFEYHPVWKDKVVKHQVFDEEGELSLEEENEWEERNGEVKAKQMIVNDITFQSYRRTEFFDPRTREDSIAYATFNDRDKVVEYVKVTYDGQDREAQEQSFSVNDSDNFTITYVYDGHNRIIAQEQLQDDKIISKINRRFNPEGLAEIVAIHSFRRGTYVDYHEYEYHG